MCFMRVNKITPEAALTGITNGSDHFPTNRNYPALEMCFKKTGHGTQCHGIVDEEVLAHRLDLVISKVFPSLVHSVVL